MVIVELFKPMLNRYEMKLYKFLFEIAKYSLDSTILDIYFAYIVRALLYVVDVDGTRACDSKRELVIKSNCEGVVLMGLVFPRDLVVYCGLLPPVKNCEIVYLLYNF